MPDYVMSAAVEAIQAEYLPFTGTIITGKTTAVGLDRLCLSMKQMQKALIAHHLPAMDLSAMVRAARTLDYLEAEIQAPGSGGYWDAPRRAGGAA